jgi:hypothetical protein
MKNKSRIPRRASELKAKETNKLIHIKMVFPATGRHHKQRNKLVTNGK